MCSPEEFDAGVVGESSKRGAVDALCRIGRRHGVVDLADEISVWYTQEDFEKFAKPKPGDGEFVE